MKTDTRNGYIRRYDMMIRRIVDLMQMEKVSAEEMEVYQRLFDVGKALEPLIYEGENTMHVSNKLQAYESRVLNAMKGEFKELGTDFEDVEEGSIIAMVIEAQTLLFKAYERVVTENSIAQHIPAVIAIKTKADDLKTVIANLMRIEVHLK